jgi:molybdenum-dependent DNA-binding transcriptional regulator ModE
VQLKSLEYLIELERAGSINKAARSLNISQQGLSKVIDSIESEVGAKLIERTHAGVSFTRQGMTFLDHAHAIVDEYDRALSDLTFDETAGADADTGFTLAISPYAVITFFDKVMVKAGRHFDITVSEWGNDKIREALRRGEGGRLYLFDWMGDDPFEDGENGGPAVSTDDHAGRFAVDRVCASRVGLLTSQDGFDKKSVDREELSQLPLICFTGGDYGQLVRSVLGEQAPDNVTMDLSDVRAHGATMSSREAGEQVYAIGDRVSWRLSKSAYPNLIFIPIEPGMFLSVGFVYDAHDPNAIRYRHFIHEFKHVYARL